MRIHPLTFVGLLVFQTGAAGAVTAPLPGTGGDDPFLGHYDIRILGKADAEKVEAAYAAPAARKTADAVRAVAEPMRQGADLLRATVPGARVELSPVGSGVEVVSGGGAPLSAPAPGQDGQAIVRGFLRTHAAIWGLSADQVEHLDIRAESQTGGTRTVSLRQTVHGRPVFQSDTRALLDADGRLLQIVGRLVPGIDESTVPEAMDLTPAEALRAALRSVGVPFDPAQLRRSRALEGARQELTVDSTVITRPITTEAVYFPLRPGLAVPAWSQVTFTRGPSDWYTVVDARTGTVLWRKDIRYHRGERAASDCPNLQNACFRVYVQGETGPTPAASPAPGPTDQPNSQAGPIHRNIVKMQAAVDGKASPHGWLATFDEKSRCFQDSAVTAGNNVDAYLDRTGDDEAETRGRLGNDPNCENRLFGGDNFDPPPSIDDPTNPESGDPPGTPAYQQGALTQLFYLANWFHDRLYGFGFKEAEGNFQASNLDGLLKDQGGLDSDPVLAEAQYGADDKVNIFNLASFSAPPDGTSGILRLSLWNGPTPNRDASLDAEVVFHELAHGVTSRMIGNGACLNWFPGRALAEGWSDFYALALLNDKATDDPAGQYAFGSYTAYRLGGHDFTDNYVYGMRRFPYATKLIQDKSVRNPVINPLTWADTDDTTDCLNNNGTMTCEKIPSGLGWESLGANEIHNAGELWAASLWEMRSEITKIGSDCPDGDIKTRNNLTLQLVTNGLKHVGCDPSFLEARQGLLDAVKETVPADDPNGACKAAVEKAIREAFKQWGLGTDACDSGGIATHYGIREGTFADENPAPDPACPVPQPLPPAGSLGSPSTYTSTIDAADTAIPDGDPRGKTFTLAIPATAVVIGDLQLKLKLTHPWVGDLTIMLKGPNGYGADLVYRLANNPTEDNKVADSKCQSVSTIPIPGLNRGDQLDIMISDDAGDLFTAGCHATNQANQTWGPVLQSDAWFTHLGARQGPLSHFRGLSLKDATTWTLFVSDVVPGGDDPDLGGNAAGDLKSWSLIVTPTSTGNSPAALSPAGTQRALGDFTAGHKVTYEIVLTNPGTGTLPNGAGPELREVLPPEVALMAGSVRASRGRATVQGNTLVWDGSLPPGGTARLTFDARIRPGTAGKTVSAQGRLRYDSGKGIAEAVTDDPTTPERGDATRFVVRSPSPSSR